MSVRPAVGPALFPYDENRNFPFSDDIIDNTTMSDDVVASYGPPAALVFPPSN